MDLLMTTVHSQRLYHGAYPYTILSPIPNPVHTGCNILVSPSMDFNQEQVSS